jgi:hypothetical protein
MKNREAGNLAIADLTSNLLAVFICLFCLTFLMITKKIESKKIDSNAEFLITITWPEESTDDIDVYVEDPLKNLIFFRSKEQGLIHLDRDDRGVFNDQIVLPDNTLYEVKENKELVTIRGCVPGEYTVNVHMYYNRDDNPTNVTIKLEKLNPQIKTITIKDVILHKTNEEKTAFRFELDRDGNVKNVNDLPKELTNKVLVPIFTSPPIDSNGDGFDDHTGQYIGDPNVR